MIMKILISFDCSLCFPKVKSCCLLSYLAAFVALTKKLSFVHLFPLYCVVLFPDCEMSGFYLLLIIYLSDNVACCLDSINRLTTLSRTVLELILVELILFHLCRLPIALTQLDYLQSIIDRPSRLGTLSQLEASHFFIESESVWASQSRACKHDGPPR